MEKKNKHVVKRQVQVIDNIINDISAGNYRNASVLIRFYLNDNAFYWYKSIDSIIEDQISNLFLDIEQDFKNNYTIGFFKHIKDGLLYDIENGY